MLAEQRKHDEWMGTHRQRLKRWADDVNELGPAALNWKPDGVWRVVMASGRKLGYPTRTFVERWVEELKRAGPSGVVADDSNARTLVRGREVQLKRARARLTNPRRLEMWGGDSGTGRMAYRWGAAKRILNDIYDDWRRATAMLGTHERTLLLDNLRPPAGYRLRRAVGTSFTLDLMALLTAPLAFTFFDAHDDDGAPVADPVALLEALRRHAEKVTLFCQAGAISVPKPGPDHSWPISKTRLSRSKRRSEMEGFSTQRFGCSTSRPSREAGHLPGTVPLP